MKIKQVFVPYWDWEDYVAGMWRKAENEPLMLSQAIDFTGDHIVYGEAMLKVAFEWPKTMLNSLTNQSINRRAFLGHCAVCLTIGCPEYITRQAWKHLTDEQRYKADLIAEKTIKHWERKYAESNRKLHKGLGAQMLFGWPA